MKVLIKFIAIAQLTFISCYKTEAQVLDMLQQYFSKEVEFKDLSVKKTDKTPIFYYRGELFTGTVINPWNKNYIKNGKLSGYNKIFDDDGNLLLETTFVDGIMEGPFIIYHKGKVDRKGIYRNGIEVGHIQGFHDDGKISIDFYNNNEGEFDGPYVRYASDGQILEKVTYQNGKMEGPFIEYYYDGKVFMKGSYVNGKKEGYWIENPQTEYEFQHFEIYYSNGEPIRWRKTYTGKTTNKSYTYEKDWTNGLTNQSTNRNDVSSNSLSSSNSSPDGQKDGIKPQQQGVSRSVARDMLNQTQQSKVEKNETTLSAVDQALQKRNITFRQCSGVYELGCYNPNAISKVQECLGLIVTGYYGRDTLKKLKELGYERFTDNDIKDICAKASQLRNNQQSKNITFRQCSCNIRSK